MEKIVRLLLAMVVILAFAGVARGGEFVITGYPVDEFAVKGEVERQLNKLVTEIQAKQLTDHELQIKVVGSADSTGVSAANDRLARDRAEQVAAVLAANFQKARIHVWSRGDAENLRQVRVEWKYVPIPKPEPAPTPVVVIPPPESSVKLLSSIKLLGGLIALAVVLFLVFVFIARKAIKKPTVAVAVAEPKSITKWVEGEADGRKYSVPIEVRDGKFFSPFKTLEDPTKILFRSDWQGIKKAVRGCMDDSRYAGQKMELIKKGGIKIN